MKVHPSDTYHIAELGIDGHETYATTAHVSQLKSWQILREDDDGMPPERGNGDESLSEDEANDEIQSNTADAERHDTGPPRRNYLSPRYTFNDNLPGTIKGSTITS